MTAALATAPTSSRTKFRTDVQGLRGIAVFIVVAFHAGTFIRGGFIGVDVFFVISGFVITLGLHSELRTTGTLRLGRFYERRIRRLLPALSIVTLVVLAASRRWLDIAGGQQSAADTARAASTFIANVHLESAGGGYFARAAERNPLLHTWSLSVEEQFYAVFPILAAISWRIGRRRRHPEASLRLAVSLATFTSLTATLLVVGSGDTRLAFYLTPLRAWEFGLGVLVGLNLNTLERSSRSLSTAMSVVGAVLVMASALLISDATQFPGAAAIPPVVGTALILAGGVQPTARLAILSWRPLVWIGDRSYGWYLWHWPAIVLAVLLWPSHGYTRFVAAMASIIPTAISYRWIEEPIRRNQRIRGIYVVGLAVLLISLPFLVGGLVKSAANQDLRRGAPELGQYTSAWSSGCNEVPWPAERCTYGPPDAEGLIVLIGDSHATVMGDVVTFVASQLHRRTAVLSKPACPASLRASTYAADCAEWQRYMVAEVRGLQPDAVVIVNRAPAYLFTDATGTGRIQDSSGRAVTDEAAALEVWADGLEELLTELAVPTLIVHTVPQVPDDVAARIGTDVDTPDMVALSLEEHQLQTGRATAVENRVAAEFDDVLVTDPAEILCASDCLVRADGMWRYFDEDHLTPTATLLLSDQYRERLQKLLSGETTGSNR